ncbi:retrovirus-related pol polyprotein from transposon TNT 1-94 [Tanacetum coccineum]
MVKTGLVEAIDSLVSLDERLATFRGTDIQEKDKKKAKNDQTKHGMEKTKSNRSQSQSKSTGKSKNTRVTLQKEEEAKQVHLDSLLVQRLVEEEELNEQQKKKRAQVQFETQHYTDEDWDLIRAKIEANAELSKSMLGSDLQGEDFAKKMVDLVNQWKKYFAEERARAKRNKPMTQSQLRTYMMNYLKNQGTWKLSQLKNLSFEEVKEEFDKLVKQVESFAPINFEATKDSLKRFGEELQTKTSKRLKSDEAKDDESTKKTGKRRKQIARKGLHSDKTDEDESEASKDADPISGTNIPINPVPVAIKPPSIATYKIIKQGKEGVYQIVREDGTDIVYINFGAMLKDITMDDLTELYRIVMNRYGMNGPEDELEKSSDIYMLTERKYPLTAEVCKAMLDKKLQGGKPNKDCYKLLKWMEKQAGIRKHKDWLVQEQTALGKDFSNPLMADNLPKIVWLSTHHICLTVNVAGIEVNVVDPKSSIELPDDLNMPELEDIRSKLIEAMQDESTNISNTKGLETLSGFTNGKKAIGLNGFTRTRRMKEMDVKSAFLYGKIEEEVYVCQPLEFEDPDFLDRVYKVEKALYGLQKAPRAWYETLSTYLLDNRFQRGKIDKTLFIRRVKGDILLVQVEAEGRIFISQDKYMTNILKKFGFTVVKTASTPMETHKPLLKDVDGEDVDEHLYRFMIGSLMYQLPSRKDLKLCFGNQNSTTGGCQFLGCRMISWQCKKQTVVANSITKAEYIVLLMVCDQFWDTVKAKTVNGEVQLQALVDKKKVIITESTIRRDLQLEDANGVDCLPNAAIFEQLTLMGYEKLS